MSYTIVIPARYSSTRFPGKLLADLAGKSILQRTFECANNSLAERVIIATDDERIAALSHKIGAENCMTSDQHKNGSERLAEVANIHDMDDDEVVVNLQGDEPFMPTECLNQVAELLESEHDCGMATLCRPLIARADIDNPDIVKIITDRYGYAVYFSRAPVPWNRDNPASAAGYFRHIGLYAYTARFLKRYADMPTCEPESAEVLEQLRVLWNGEKIKVGITELDTGMGIDTPEDLKQAIDLIRSSKRL